MNKSNLLFKIISICTYATIFLWLTKIVDSRYSVPINVFLGSIPVIIILSIVATHFYTIPFYYASVIILVGSLVNATMVFSQ